MGGAASVLSKTSHSSSLQNDDVFDLSSMSFFDKQNLMVKSIKNKDFSLAYKIFTDDENADYKADLDLEDLIFFTENDRGYTSLFLRMSKENFLKPDFLRRNLRDSDETKDMITFFSRIISVTDIRIKNTREKYAACNEAIKESLKNFTTALVKKSDIKNMTHLYLSVPPYFRDEIEKNLVEIFGSLESINGLSHTDYLNSLVTQKSLVEVAPTNSSCAKAASEEIEPGTHPIASSTTKRLLKEESSLSSRNTTPR